MFFPTLFSFTEIKGHWNVRMHMVMWSKHCWIRWTNGFVACETKDHVFRVILFKMSDCIWTILEISAAMRNCAAFHIFRITIICYLTTSFECNQIIILVFRLSSATLWNMFDLIENWYQINSLSNIIMPEENQYHVWSIFPYVETKWQCYWWMSGAEVLDEMVWVLKDKRFGAYKAKNGVPGMFLFVVNDCFLSGSKWLATASHRAFGNNFWKFPLCYLTTSSESNQITICVILIFWNDLN